MEDFLKETFCQRFGIGPQFVVRAPGRVNLIGEHIDYNGYGVLPMALQQSIYCAVSAQSDLSTLDIRNVDNGKYEDVELVVDDYTFERSVSRSPKWYEYFVCGYRGVVEFLTETQRRAIKHIGMKILIGADIPPSSGLYSSSALVCAAALCTWRVLTGSEVDLTTRHDLAEICAKSERYIGTEGGGMDQAKCLLAEQGKAKLLTFNPLTAHNVELPSGGCFVISNSCVEANKAASHYFNERVLETRFAAKLMAYKLGLKNWEYLKNLGCLHSQLKNKTLTEMMDLVNELLTEESYSYESILLHFDNKCGENQLQAELIDKLKLEQDEIRLKLKQRALHVFGEADRVEKFVNLCRKLSGETCLLTLGQMMDESHASCRDLYDCSCNEVDELQLLAKKFGAYGSRLTGAGWGGCVVSLVATDQCEMFVENLRNSYYVNFTPEMIKTNLFTTQPGRAAQLIMLQHETGDGL